MYHWMLLDSKFSLLSDWKAYKIMYVSATGVESTGRNVTSTQDSDWLRSSSVAFLKCHFPLAVKRRLCQAAADSVSGAGHRDPERRSSVGALLLKGQRERQWGSVKLFLFLTDFFSYLSIFMVPRVISSVKNTGSFFFSPSSACSLETEKIGEDQESSP